VTASGTHVADAAADFAVWMTMEGSVCRAYRGVVQEVERKSSVSCLMGIEVGKVSPTLRCEIWELTAL
jgi:hypothetical protein